MVRPGPPVPERRDLGRPSPDHLLDAKFNAEQRELAIRAGMPADLEPFAELRDGRDLHDQKREPAEHAMTFPREDDAPELILA